MKEIHSINRTVEITADDLREFLRSKGFNPSEDTVFEVSGNDHNWDTITVCVGNARFPDDTQPIIATWIEIE